MYRHTDEKEVVDYCLLLTEINHIRSLAMSTNKKEDDPILSMLKSRREEQEEMAKLSLEIQKKQIESKKK